MPFFLLCGPYSEGISYHKDNQTLLERFRQFETALTIFTIYDLIIKVKKNRTRLADHAILLQQSSA